MRSVNQSHLSCTLDPEIHKPGLLSASTSTDVSITDGWRYYSQVSSSNEHKQVPERDTYPNQNSY